LMAAAGAPLALVGVYAATLVPQRGLAALFASVLLLTAWRYFGTSAAAYDKAEHPANASQSSTAHAEDASTQQKVEAKSPRLDVDAELIAPARKSIRIHRDTGRFVWTWVTACKLGAIGMLTGFASGLLGVGGGFIMVPLLSRFTELDGQGVVGTSLMVMALVSSSAALFAAVSPTRSAFDIPTGIALTFVSAMAIGMVIGRLLIRSIAPQTIRRLFASLLLVAAGLMLLRVFA
jgi:uncharacterized protein